MGSDIIKKDKYKIKVEGKIDQSWSNYIDDWEVSEKKDFTILISPKIDQSALHGILSLLRDMCINIEKVEKLKDIEN